MIKFLAQEVMKWLNMFPPKGRMSSSYSPHAIMTGYLVDYKKHCTIPFGSYVQAVHETNPTNTMAPCTLDAIYLQALDTIQKGYELMNLKMAKTFTSCKVVEIPIIQDVVA